jgi:hypothetical protein
MFVTRDVPHKDIVRANVSHASAFIIYFYAHLIELCRVMVYISKPRK